ncbi:ribonuclease 2 [Lolium perenne]|uniref:ribonuclease 2 n=1 Tax=Lolium perenne TaxID=4522 RepID=UPI0021F67FEE|nr:ribonuclease 2-like [Lolium perenne]
METTRRGRRLLVSLSFLCLAVLLATASTSPATAGRKRRMAGFDYYVLALQWPGSVCRQTNHCCSSNGCCRSNPLNWFTIHGLWPQYSYGGWPSCCRQTTPFNMNKIAMLRPILERYWPSLYCGDSSTCFGRRGPFWVHEVKTHGTCAYPEIQDEYDYFSTALYLYSKYNVTKALRKAHIYPRNGRKYEVGHIVAAIDHAFGRLPHIVCKNGSVQELRLCFHKDYQPRDCGSETDDAWSSSRRSHCPRYVTLPSYKKSAMANATEGGLRNRANNEPRAYGQS